MNNKQRILLFFIAAVAGLIGLHPPYLITRNSTVIKSGHAFIFDLPFRSYINVSAWAVQIVAVLVIGGLLYLALRDTQDKENKRDM